MKHRIFSLILALSLSLSLLCVNAFAELPKGYWPLLSAYNTAIESGNEADVMAKGDAYLAFLAKFERNEDIAHNFYNVYLWRLEHEVYEKNNDWDGAIKNTKALLEVSQYLQSLGIDRADMITRCQTHLAALEPFYGIYAASYTQSNTYGSKIAAPSGTFYGTPIDGSYSNGSIVSVYVELESQSADAFDYLIAPKADGKRVILINLNFKGEGATARAIPSGAYDASLQKTFNYLAKLKSPVLVRIGAEFNVWTSTVTPADFIAAYNHVASLARSLAPNAELVWSPNYSSSWGVNLADFYPNNALVDWIGMSLYYNYTNPGGDSIMWQEFTHSGRFADPINSAAEVVAVARAKGKPVVATESGVHRAYGESFASVKAAKEFSTVTMAYPEVKALVYFDKSFNGNDYTLTGAVKTAVGEAIHANPTLIASGEKSAATYIPIQKLNEAMTGTLVLGATGRTYHSSDMSATWVLDGKTTATTGSPNQLRVDLNTLGEGNHKLEVTLSDNAGYTVPAKVYTLSYIGGNVKITEGYTAAPAPAANVAYASTQSVSLDNKPITLTAYALKDAAGNQTNYVRLRDIAQLLNGTSAQFNVMWSPESGIGIASRSAYANPNGTEGKLPFSGNQTYQKFTGATLVDGQASGLDAFTITYDGSGHTFYQLRHLGKALGFNVGWSAERGMFIETNMPYTDAN
ncbi:MAG: hypothetical protein IKN81_03200 [Oscillospiraceae bacterium]|nr:hypothetical protein [Oscillospiraceae bacterium]